MTDSISILIIDDSKDDRLLYRRALQKSSGSTYEIAEANDGDMGLAMLADHTPTCVLLDYSLPGRNGIEVLKRIHVQHPFVPVVMLTGQGNEEIAVAAIREGAQNYIVKANITPEAIQRVIRVAIEHCALEKRIHEQRLSLEIFSRAMAHDLKEPVRTMSSFLDLMAQETFSPRGKEYFQYVQKSAERMGALIDTVYFYTKLDSTQEQPARDTCDVGKVLEEVKDNITQLIQEKRASITNDKLPPIHANRMQLLQILQNLICNSIRHSETDPRIHIHAEETDNQWVFRVSDNGPGIDAQYQTKLFQPFKRGSRSKEHGLGLGLAICKKIVEGHGGKIWYEPGTDKGANFVFSLPKPETERKQKPAVASASPAPSNQKNSALASMLLVEDNEADIQLARILLIERPQLQCNFLVAHDAYEALTMLRAEAEKTGAVDLILLDINMPGMDGFELLERLRTDKELKDIPVVMCSTSTHDTDMERAKSLGVAGYMSKPAEIEKLKAIIDRAPGLRLEKDKEGYSLRRAA